MKRTVQRRTSASRQDSFDPKVFLKTEGGGHAIVKYRTRETVFSQGSPADVVFYVLKGKVKLTVVSEQGKEAVVAIHGPDEFFGEGMPDRTAAALGHGRRSVGLRDHAAGEGGHGPRAP